MAITAVFVFATVITLVVPYLAGENLDKRIKAVATERDKLRAALLEQLDEGSGAKLRQDPKTYMQELVQKLNLRKLMEKEDTKTKLAMAGYRGQAPIYAFLFFQVVVLKKK